MVVKLTKDIKMGKGTFCAGMRINVTDVVAMTLIRKRQAVACTTRPVEFKGACLMSGVPVLPPVKDVKPLGEMTKAELLDFARSKKLAVKDSMTKAEILELCQP